MEVLIEPIGCLVTCQRIELGLHEALVTCAEHITAVPTQRKTGTI